MARFMKLCTLTSGPLHAELSYDTVYNDLQGSYNVRIYLQHPEETDPMRSLELIMYKSFGNGHKAEDWLLEKMEYPAWVLLEAM